MRIRLAVAIVAGAVLAAAVIAPDVGAATKVRSKITISLHGSKFKGKVKSRKAICKKHRKVLLYRGHKKIDRTKTNRRGKWHVNIGHKPRAGRYHSVAKKKKHGSIVCKRAKSRTITVRGGGGGAGTGTFNTQLTVAFTRSTDPYFAGAFSGTVGSPLSACISGRSVAVFMQGNTTPVASATSNSSGSWHTAELASVPSGNYFAVTPKKSVNAGTCAAGQSPTISAP